MEPALELAQQVLSIARSVEDTAPLHTAHFLMGQTYFWMGQFMPAQTHLELSCSLYDPARDPFHAVPSFRFDLHGFCKGVHPLMFSGTAAWYLGFRGCLAMATAQRGAALVAGGHAEEGITQLREGLDGSGGAFEVMRTLYLAYLAEGYALAGRVDEGLAVLAEAMALVESTGVRSREAEIYRLKGELTLKRSEANSNSEIKEEAESFFRRAIEVARRQSAKSWELRATMSLARLLDKQGRRDEVRAMLADIYGWFTEGFDTADLKEAKALLDELNR